MTATLPPARLSPSRPAGARLLRRLAFSSILLFSASALQAQVTIPAQSASSRDEDPEPETVITAPVPQTGTLIQRNTTISQMPPPPPTSAPAPQPAPTARPGEPVAAMQRVPPVVQNIDGAKIDRLAELRRELRVADAASLARITLHTDNLFLLSKPGEVDELAIPTLKKVAEYIKLNDKQDVTLRSYFIPDQEDGKELAWKRSLVLIEWIAERTGLAPGQFRATSPEPVQKPSPKAFATKVGDTEFINRTEFILE